MTGCHLVERPAQSIGDRIGDLVVGRRTEPRREPVGAAGIDRLGRLIHRLPLLHGSVRAPSGCARPDTDR
ncbi:hypothetical protein RAJCM14343_1480 [Rhodococcus aetherivorans]|uniref:Uncharacterized protein n=1 Tax=Rhodococcus aetherivorans TaxID=191292 RepID=A0ABQ0YI64_9NOCA|nr:hypothetical protein RAJCM14343_1480 [Rhodococcus aetherivorans]